MNSTFAIETSDLRKHYGAVEALRGVSLTVPVGAICGFLGRNGAGTTTTIKVLLGMARPRSSASRLEEPRRPWTCADASASSATTRISSTT